MPFWIDPIWTNNNNEKPKSDLVSKKLVYGIFVHLTYINV